MKRSLLFIALAVMVMSPMKAFGLASISLGGGNLFTDTLANPLPMGSTIVLFADADMDGFDDLGDAFVSFDQAGDIPLAIFGSDDSAGPGTFFNTVIIDVTDLIGKDMAVAWYNTPYDPTRTGPGGNVPFGLFRTDNVESFSTTSWVVPPDGETHALNFLTLGQGGPNAEDFGLTTQVTAVPEPASALMLLAGTASLFLRRKNARA